MATLKRHASNGQLTRNIRDHLPIEVKTAYLNLFKSIDKDGSGSISIDELYSMFKQQEIPITREEVDEIFQELDEDESGELEFPEFALVMTRLQGEVDKRKGLDKITWRDTWKVMTTKEVVWVTLSDPNSSPVALAFSIIVMIVIVISCTVFCIETVVQVEDAMAPSFWSTIELLMVVIFTLEYLLRLLSTPSMRLFLLAPLNLVDLLAILPFYVEAIVTALTSSSKSRNAISTALRLFRLVRIVRIFKLSRYFAYMRMVGNAFVASLAPLAMVCFVCLLWMIVFSSLLYFAERGDWLDDDRIYVDANGKPTWFQSIPSCFWIFVITTTTVGYGDNYPSTPFGKLMCCIAAIAGITIIAIPISIFSAKFVEEQSRELERKQLAEESHMSLADRARLKKEAEASAVTQEEFDTALHKEINAAIERSRAELQKQIAVLEKRHRRNVMRQLFTWWQINFPEALFPELMDGIRKRLHDDMTPSATPRMSARRNHEEDNNGESPAWHVEHLPAEDAKVAERDIDARDGGRESRAAWGDTSDIPSRSAATLDRSMVADYDADPASPTTPAAHQIPS